MARIEVPGKIKKYAGIFGKGVVAEVVPELLKSGLVEVLKKTTVKRVCEWVENDISLWDNLGVNHQKSLLKMGEFVKDLSWLTADWFIQAIRKDCPALASLFLGWEKAYSWLERQIEIIKKEIQK